MGELPLGSLSLTAISDALDVLGVDGGLPGIRPVSAAGRCVGPAYTVLLEPVSDGEEGPAAAYIDDVPPGSVVVIDNGGRSTCTVWGGLLTMVAARNELGGTVIHGCCRDVAVADQAKYPVFASGVYMKSGKNRVVLRACQTVLDVAGTVVTPNDLVVGDTHGVLVVPVDLVDSVVEIAGEVEHVERSIAEEVERRERLETARTRHGYNRYAFGRRSAGARSQGQSAGG